MKRNWSILALSLAMFSLLLTGCMKQPVSEEGPTPTITPAPAVSPTPESDPSHYEAGDDGAVFEDPMGDDLEKAGDDLKKATEDIGRDLEQAARDASRDVENALR